MIAAPGIREHFTFAEKFIKARYPFEVDFYRAAWRSGESIDSLTHDLEGYVHKRAKEGRRIALVASSSAAGLAVNSKIWDEVDKAVFICGRVRGWKEKGLTYQVAAWRSRLYCESVAAAEVNLAKLTSAQRKKIMTLTPLFDLQAPPNTCVIEGARNEKIPFIFHAGSIAIALTCMNKQITDFIS